MMISRTAGVLVAAGLSLLSAGPAHADTSTNVDNFLKTLDGLGLTGIDPAEAVSVGQSMCPLLAERGQNTADIASKVSDAIGKPLGASAMFTGAAISFLCPRAIENVSNNLSAGKLPFPLFGN